MRYAELIGESQAQVLKATGRKTDAWSRYQDTISATRDKLASAAAVKPGPQRTERINAARRKQAEASRTYEKARTSANDAIRKALSGGKA